jgi:hypothetical protein
MNRSATQIGQAPDQTATSEPGHDGRADAFAERDRLLEEGHGLPEFAPLDGSHRKVVQGTPQLDRVGGSGDHDAARQIDITTRITNGSLGDRDVVERMRLDLVQPKGLCHREGLTSDRDGLIAAAGECQVSGRRAQDTGPGRRRLPVGDEVLRPFEVRIRFVTPAVDPLGIGELDLRLSCSLGCAYGQQRIPRLLDRGNRASISQGIEGSGIPEQELGSVVVLPRPEIERIRVIGHRRSERTHCE